jgi:alpha/beta superfamily hydrolase
MFLDGPAGRIEAILKQPDGPVKRVAIVCHPQPLFGGTMHNKVVYRIARAFHEAGFAALRFNFRGVGLSEGIHDEGRGEEDDLLAAMAFAEQKFPGAEVSLSGFSFGSAVMIRVACRDSSAAGLVAVGLPVSKYEFGNLAGCRVPKLFVQGSLDEYGPVDQLERVFSGLAEPKQLVVIEGAGHFFDGHLDELSEAVSRFVNSGQLRHWS